MFRYDYTIKRDEGDKIRFYQPDLIPTELSNIVYIEGPNSSGKSTLLHLIALGFYGLKLREKELHPALREKLNNLYNSKHQEVKFRIEIHNERLSTSLISVKSNFQNKDIQVRRKDGDKEIILSPEQFVKKYKLIYDIPSDPLERLPQLLQEIQNAQYVKGNQITSFKNFIREAISGVKGAKDPNLLDELNKRLIGEKEQLKRYEDKIEQEDKRLSNLQKYAITKYYTEYTKSKEDMLNRIKEAEKIKKIKIKEVNKQSKEQADILATIREKVKSSQKCYEESSNLLKLLIPKSEKHHLEIWHHSSCIDEINAPEVNESLRLESQYFINYLQESQEEVDEEKLGEARLLRSLKELLREYSDSKITIPGTNKSVSEFIGIIEKEILKYEDIETTNENIQRCIELLNTLLNNIENAIKLSKKYGKLTKERGKTQEEIKAVAQFGEYEQLIKHFQYIENKQNYYMKELNKMDIELSNVSNIHEIYKNEFKMFEKHTENQLMDSINNFRATVIELKKDRDKIDRSISYLREEIARLEKKKPHKYQNYLVELEKYFNTVQELERKLLVTFDEHIKKIMDWQSFKNKMTSDEQKYAEGVAGFLAEKVRYIKHIDQNLLVKKIDVINKEIIADNKRRVKFADLGTGQGQGAYIAGLLSMCDDRKVIALFDEVAMMDSNTLKPIFERLQSLYKENRLLLGIIVQKAEKLQVQSLV